MSLAIEFALAIGGRSFVIRQQLGVNVAASTPMSLPPLRRSRHGLD